MTYLEDSTNAQANEADDALLWMLENGFDAKTVEFQERILNSSIRKRNIRNTSDERGYTYDPDTGKVLSSAKAGGAVPGHAKRAGQMEYDAKVWSAGELTSRATGKVAKRRKTGVCVHCGLTPCAC